MAPVFGYQARQETGIDIWGDTIEIEIQGHPVGRADSKIYFRAVGAKLASPGEK